MHRITLTYLCLLLFSAEGADSLKVTELRVSPRRVQHGSDVIMSCMFNLEDVPLYSIKWYRGSREFYRYSPTEIPYAKIFRNPGMHVDLARSNETQVVLTGVSSGISGNFSCEVTTDAPTFFTSYVTTHIDVAGAGGLRATELRISPPIVQRGSDATLACLYELHDAPLYSVKWYRGRHEFYRYSPTETPHTKIFPFAGINVDLARSNESQVVVARVSFGLSGNFSCEVTADAPSFSTSYVSAQMDVVALPHEGPSISAEHTSYSPGSILRATCKTPPSRPPTNLSFALNNVAVTSGQLRTQQTYDGLQLSELSIAVPLLSSHFANGVPMLVCEATIGNGTLYKDTSELSLQLDNRYPRIERVTSSASSPTLQHRNIPLIFLLYRCLPGFMAP